MATRGEKRSVEQLPRGHVKVRQYAQQVTVRDSTFRLQPLGERAVHGEGVRCKLHEHIHGDRQHASATLGGAAPISAPTSATSVRGAFAESGPWRETAVQAHHTAAHAAQQSRAARGRAYWIGASGTVCTRVEWQLVRWERVLQWRAAGGTPQERDQCALQGAAELLHREQPRLVEGGRWERARQRREEHRRVAC